MPWIMNMSRPPPKSNWKADPTLTTLIIPQSAKNLRRECFPKQSAVETIAFEPHSLITELDEGTFAHCPHLKHICVSASVTKIHTHCFITGERSDETVPLETVTFEPGSKLTEIATWAFSGCKSLTSITLPASLKILSGTSFFNSGIIHINFEPGNTTYKMSDHFWMEFKASRILKNYVNDSKIAIPDEVQILGIQAFAHRKSLRSVQFGPNSRLATIENEVFVACAQLESIALPGTLTSLGEAVFFNCSSLRHISFGAGASPKTLGESMFRGCKLLETFVVPKWKASGDLPWRGAPHFSRFVFHRQFREFVMPASAIAQLCGTCLSRPVPGL
jgi:hypothetical protein